MKKLLPIFAALLAAACTQQAEPVAYDAPQVEFPMENSVVDAVVGEPVTFEARLVSGDRVSCAWYIDDLMESSAQSFTYTFTEPGSYDVRFEASNGGGSVERSYTAIVTDAFEVVLSVGDSLEVSRRQLDRINVAAIVKKGSDIVHRWTVNGVEAGSEAYLDYTLNETGKIAVAYHGENSVGSFDKSFSVSIVERPLEMSYSIYDQTISVKKNQPVSITATAIYGGTGLVHSWYVDGVLKSSDATLTWTPVTGGLFLIKYEGVNAKGETAGRTWSVSVVSQGYVLDDFETGSSLASWWTLGQNSPGIELVDNPDKSGINTSDHCMKDNVAGTGGTSGYFDLKGKDITASGIDITQYNGIRIKVWLDKNPYYPRIQVNGTKYAPVSAPKFNGGWEELEFQFPSNFTSEQVITFRPMLKEDGNSISSGAVSDTNTRTVYIDDIEFLN